MTDHPKEVWIDVWPGGQRVTLTPQTEPHWQRYVHQDALKAAYLAGFNASGEGGNGEYPYQDKGTSPEADEEWCASRDHNLKELNKCLSNGTTAPDAGAKIAKNSPYGRVRNDHR